MSEPKKQRLLVFIVAYYAEKTLRWVLDRIPAQLFDTYDTEVLVVDDASSDATFAIGHAWNEDHPERPVTVLRNEFNQGYGGNQKVGYAYAMAHGFDFVAMVHGDGQYAPEELPRLVEPLARGEADAVFGSRMMTATGALKGGMPLYKYLGNRLLSWTQNRLLGSRLSEFHSGYRVYRVKALEQLPFRLNSNDFHFDTEIIIQLLNAKLRLKELSIPTHYGDEVCRVDGMRYAKDVMVATTQNVLHRAGLLYQRRFEIAPDAEPHEALKLGYPSSHQVALDLTPPGAQVVEIGAGPDHLSEELRKKGCGVHAIYREPPDAALPGVEAQVADLDRPAHFTLGDASHLLMLDVVEHLKNPEGFFDELRAQFDYRPRTLLLTTPNIAFAVPRLMMLLGHFNYGKVGILARSHTRLFTFRTVRRLLTDAGFRVKDVRGLPAPFPKVFGDGPLGRGLLKLNQAAIALSPGLFSYQIFVVAESTPNVDFVLANTRESSASRAAKLKGPAAVAARPRPRRKRGAAQH